jgi:hypothetical protein
LFTLQSLPRSEEVRGCRRSHCLFTERMASSIFLPNLWAIIKAYITKNYITLCMTTVIVRPSSLLSNIQIEKLGNFNLFKFDRNLQARMEELLERKKTDLLTAEEAIQLEEIGELDRIFTHINAMLVAQK